MPVSREETKAGARTGPNRGHESGEKSSARGTSPLEWTVAAFSALLVITVMVVMLIEAFTEPETPPLIEIVIEEVRPAVDGYVVLFQARNLGQTTAAGLVIEGELRRGQESVEKASVTIDFVPADGSHRAGLFFTHDPESLTLEILPRGYDEP